MWCTKHLKAYSFYCPDCASPGRKDDKGKRRYDLVDSRAHAAMVDGLTYGANKYGDHNWRLVENASDRYYAAAMRHLEAHRQGEIIDPESGIPHLALAQCSLHFLLALQPEQKKVDPSTLLDPL